MNKPKHFLLLFFLFCFAFVACDKVEDNEEPREPSTIYLQKSLPGNFNVNGQDIVLNENSSTNNSVVDYIDVENFPSGNVYSINISM